MSCAIKIYCFQNFYKVMKTGSSGAKSLFAPLGRRAVSPPPLYEKEKDLNVMVEQLEHLKWRMHFCMAAMGGIFGTYMILRFGHFASALTVNLLEILTGTTKGIWHPVLLKLCGVLVFTLAVVLTAKLSLRGRGDLRRSAVLIDAAAAAVLCAVPEDAEWSILISLFAMAFQWCAFSSRYGCPCSTIFSTNNFRQFVDAWVQIRSYPSEDHVLRFRLYGGTLLFFHAGAAAVCVLWRLGCGRWTILGSLIPACWMLFRLWKRRSRKWRNRERFFLRLCGIREFIQRKGCFFGKLKDGHTLHFVLRFYSIRKSSFAYFVCVKERGTLWKNSLS